MSKFRRRGIFNAFQWFKHGDVKEVVMIPFTEKVSDAKRTKLGWIHTPQGGHIVYPGDWVLIDKHGVVQTCNPTTFTKLYEAVEPEEQLANWRDRSI